MSRGTKYIYRGKKGEGREGNGKRRAEDIYAQHNIYATKKKFLKNLKYESLGRQ